MALPFEQLRGERGIQQGGEARLAASLREAFVQAATAPECRQRTAGNVQHVTHRVGARRRQHRQRLLRIVERAGRQFAVKDREERRDGVGVALLTHQRPAELVLRRREVRGRRPERQHLTVGGLGLGKAVALKQQFGRAEHAVRRPYRLGIALTQRLQAGDCGIDFANGLLCARQLVQRPIVVRMVRRLAKQRLIQRDGLAQ